MILYKEIIQVYMDSEYCNDILIFFSKQSWKIITNEYFKWNIFN